MIYGDPFYFSLQFDAVESWNSSDGFWKNGIFFFYLDGYKIFDLLDVFELKTTFSFYSNMKIDALVCNDVNIEPVSLYRNAESYFTGDGENLIEGLFDMTCTPMGDNGYYVYFMKTSHNDRFVWSNDDGKTINETLLPPGTVGSVIKKLSNY
ncbi:immunity 42 family protein [Photorhabdus heterorhabditis]|uniref:Uncharacterized protein n=1 Tax=Photorhabdus heterorhabditis TaxID=880156 RepID=A0ABR5K6W4_9GAMM|nr:immunity 42 family protein [Photorhabdus heterorhabditis]KOY60301.1 hypothetical protein AM629_20070 [Photorhabdus heterorhabditis]MBS9444367.1 hypothetical protein [Photorhabdus heterorhabditis]